MAVANYEQVHNRLPPAFVRGPDRRPWHSWRVLILPHIEGQKLFDAYRFDEPWDGPNNRTLADRMPPLYAFHGTERPTVTTNYLAVVGKETMWPGDTGRKFADVKDGTSNTILLVENLGLNVHWMEPRDLVFADMDFRIDAPAGVSSWYKGPSVVTADGAVRKLSEEMAPEALRAALTVAGGEDLSALPGGWTTLADGRDRERKE